MDAVKYRSEHRYRLFPFDKLRTPPHRCLGSAVKDQLTSPTGDITFATTYDPYGVVTSTAGTAQTSYGYTGEFTSNEMVYLRARYYTPGMGRFLTRDTWSGDSQIPLSFNAWNYTYSNPINYSDPSGYCSGTIGLDAEFRLATQFFTPNVLNGESWKATGNAWNTCIESFHNAGIAFGRGDYGRGIASLTGVTASFQHASARIAQINRDFDTLDCSNASWSEKFYAGVDIGAWSLNVASFIAPVAQTGWVGIKGLLANKYLGGLGPIGYYDDMLGYAERYTGKYQKLPGYTWEESVWIQRRLENPTMESFRPCHYASTCGLDPYPLYPADIQNLNQGFKLAGDLKSNMVISELQPGDLLTYYRYSDDIGSTALKHSNRVLSVDDLGIQVFDKPGIDYPYSQSNLSSVMDAFEWLSILVFRK